MDKAKVWVPDGPQLRTVQQLLKVSAMSCGLQTDLEETPLHLAARHSKADVAKKLLDSGADINSRVSLNRTPLHLAIGADAQEVFQTLLMYRAINVEARMVDGTTPLILAARYGLSYYVRYLIEANANVNVADNEGRTALHWAVAVDSMEVTKELLRYDANIDAQDKKGQTPLFLACREGNTQTVEHLIVNYAKPTIADTMGITPEVIAKQRHHQDIVELLSNTDLLIGCNSPKIVSAPTSPSEGQKSLVASMASPSATSPPAVEINDRGGPAMMPHFQLECPKNTVNSGQVTPRPARQAKRKQKIKVRLDLSASLSPNTNNVVTSCATGQAFSPNCMPITNSLSPLKCAGISPADSTILSSPPMSVIYYRHN